MGRRERKEYPWGLAAPSVRVRDVSARLRKALGGTEVASGVETVGACRNAALASRAVVETLEYFSAEGLRSKGGAEPVACEEVLKATGAVRAAVAALADASMVELSVRYGSYVQACEVLLALAERVVLRGVACEGPGSSHDWAWREFGVTRRS